MLEVGAVLELLFGWELEDLLADGELAINLVLGQAEVRDVAIRLSANPYDGKDLGNDAKGQTYKKPTLWTALLSWSASFCLPPGASNCERSRVMRSAQSTFTQSWSARVRSYAHHRILTLCFGFIRLSIHRQLVRNCTGCGLYFGSHRGFRVGMS